MTRLETLERVLVAAQAVLAARNDQMLTRVEWDALATAVVSARTREARVCNQPVRIVFGDGLMVVMDDLNQGCDGMDLCDCSIEHANEQIDRWATQYSFDVDVAKRELAEYLSEL